MQTTKIFTGDVRCKNNNRLGSMHTSDTRRSVWHKNQLLHSFQQGARSLTRETEEEEEEEYDDENSRFTYE